MAAPPTLRTDVLVVGAGPSGLMAALCLARLRVDVILVDGKVVGRRLPWSGDNFRALRTMTWQVHGYGAVAEAVTATAAALGFDAHLFGPDIHRRLDTARLYLVRPDGFVAAAARPGEALTRFRAYLGSA